jgi:hypothetical protein
LRHYIDESCSWSGRIATRKSASAARLAAEFWRSTLNIMPNCYFAAADLWIVAGATALFSHTGFSAARF